MTPALPFISIIVGIGSFHLSRFFPVSTIVLLLALLTAFFLHSGRKIFLSALIILGAFLYASCRIDQPHEGFDSQPGKQQIHHIFSSVQKNMPFSSIVTGLPISVKNGYIQEIRMRQPRVEIKSFLIIPEPLMPGYYIHGIASITENPPRLNPGGYYGEPSVYVKPDNEISIIPAKPARWLHQRIRWRLYNYFRENFSTDVATLLSAIVIGHREAARDPLYFAYSSIGLVHLMSISGTHFGLFSLLVFTLIRFSCRLLPYRWLVRLTSRLSLDEIGAIITLPLILAYLALSGGRIPALRSFIMINVFLLGLLIGRRGQWFSSLTVAAAVILIIDPSSLTSISFQLSFIAVLSIGLTLDLLDTYLGKNKPEGVPGMILKLAAVTVGALIGTSPLVLYYFHTIPILGLPANIILAPLICFTLLPLGIFGGIIYLVSGHFPLSAILQTIGHAFNTIVTYLADLGLPNPVTGPFPFVSLFLVYPAIYFILRRRWALSILTSSGVLLIFLLSYQISDSAYSQVTFLDVGQGEGTVIETSGGKTVVIDTGRSGREVLDYLKYRGISTIDALSLSHGAIDHAGGIGEIISNIRVREIWDNGYLRYNVPLGKGVIHQPLTAGDVLTERGSRFIVLHPHRNYYSLTGSDDNNYSLVLRYLDGPLSILFTGDIESDAEESLLHLKGYLRSDVLKIAHHGSYTSSTHDFIRTVSPSVAVISAGRNNPYGHPHESTLKRLKGIQVMRTDRDGAVKVFIDRYGNINVRRYRDYQLQEVKGLDMVEELKNLKRLFLVW
jgi:competence protein ComEC